MLQKSMAASHLKRLSAFSPEQKGLRAVLAIAMLETLDDICVVTPSVRRQIVGISRLSGSRYL
jgi:hypothetical protein